MEKKYEIEEMEKEAEINKLKNVELAEINKELKKALKEVKILSGLLPICAGCKKIRDDEGYWQQINLYFEDHSDAHFINSLCPECLKKI